MRPFIFNDENPLAQLAATVLICITCLLLIFNLGSVLSTFLFHIHPNDFKEEVQNFKNIPFQKFMQMIQGIGLFLIPPFILGKLFTGRSLDYLRLNVIPAGYKFLLVIVIVISALPVIDLLSMLNSMIKLPGSMAGIQKHIDESSKMYQTISESFMKGTSIQVLLVNLLIIAVIPALGEEFLFRGVLQRIFTNWTKNSHWGIFIAAFIFSAIHGDFYGFIPRLLLGMMFGYFLLWSGSIWLPVLAHFINNAMAVVIYYFINNGVVSEKMAATGSFSDTLPFTVISFALMGTCIYLLFKKRLEF